MSEVRSRLEAHRKDVLVLLKEVSHTAQLHDGFRLAGAVGHIARAQVLLAEELFGLPEGAERPASTKSPGAPTAQFSDDTPAEGIRLHD